MKISLFKLLVVIFLSFACHNIKNPEVKVLAQGALISGTNGIIFNSSDQLYIASVNEQAIIVMDPASGDRVNVLYRIDPN